MESGNQAKIGAALLGLLVIAFIGVTLYQSQKNTDGSTQPSSTAQQATPTIDATIGAYKNGTYDAVGNYISPGGEEELGVTVTLAKGIITDAAVEVKATRPISKTRQEDFAANFKGFVVGKNIDDVRLSKVSGSSLTPNGFNDALEKIKAEAKS